MKSSRCHAPSAPPALLVALLLVASAAEAADLVVDGTTRVITDDTVVDGEVRVENGGTLIVRECRLTLKLDYDEEHHIDVDAGSTLVVDDAIVTSTGGQYWIELSGDGPEPPRMEVHGDDSWITNHSGIRPFDAAEIEVTGGDVEELQVRERTAVTLEDAAVYPVFFFDGVTASLSNLDTGSSITNTIAVPGGWSFSLDNADIEGYQIDLMNGADVTLDSGDGIVASFHTPGNLGDELRIVEGITSHEPISGAVTNLGSRFTFTDSNIALVNLYAFGFDRVLLRDVHVNEVNAEQSAQVIVGQKGHSTRLNCNLCQVYDSARLTAVQATIDANDNLPSATAASGDFEPVGRGVMAFSDMDLRQLDLAAIEEGTFSLRNCLVNPSRIDVVDPTATVRQWPLEADFTSIRRRGDAPFEARFLDLSGGDIDEWTWDFGDGSTSQEQEPVHTYTQGGTYDVTLTVRQGTDTHTLYNAEAIVVTSGGGGGGGGDGPCVAGDTTLCLGPAGRFRVEAEWEKPNGERGRGHALPLTADTGVFWFFRPDNIEMVLKVLDACGPFERFWVFAGGLTSVRTEITVTDTAAGMSRRYVNPQRTPFQPIQDNNAFATCP